MKFATNLLYIISKWKSIKDHHHSQIFINQHSQIVINSKYSSYFNTSQSHFHNSLVSCYRDRWFHHHPFIFVCIFSNIVDNTPTHLNLCSHFSSLNRHRHSRCYYYVVYYYSPRWYLHFRYQSHPRGSPLTGSRNLNDPHSLSRLRNSRVITSSLANFTTLVSTMLIQEGW